MQNQQARHHSQNTQLFFPSIISMSWMKRFPPAKVWAENITAAARAAHSQEKAGFTVYVADADDLEERQKQQHPAGDKLVDEGHPVDSCLVTHTNTHWGSEEAHVRTEQKISQMYPGDTREAQEIEDEAGWYRHQNPFVWQVLWEGISQAGGEHL